MLLVNNVSYKYVIVALISVLPRTIMWETRLRFLIYIIFFCFNRSGRLITPSYTRTSSLHQAFTYNYYQFGNRTYVLFLSHFRSVLFDYHLLTIVNVHSSLRLMYTLATKTIPDIILLCIILIVLYSINIRRFTIVETEYNFSA